MTSRERVQTVLQGGKPDRMPFNFWMDRDKMAEYDARWGHDFRLTHFDADVIEAFIGIGWWAGATKGKMVADEKTVWLTKGKVDSLEEALELDLPDPNTEGVCADINAKREKYPDKAIFAMTAAPLDIYYPLRLEHMYIDLIDHADEVHTLLKRAKEVLLQVIHRVCATDIDVLYLAGDICSKNGPMVSPKLLAEFNFDYLMEVIDIAHQAGKKVFYHTDGFVMPIIKLFCDYKFDGINPLEYRFHDFNEFLKRTEGKLMVYGALDNCDIIPNGTPDQVAAHVREVFDLLGKDGKLIFSTHDIPSNCPLENLETMVETIKNCTY